MTSPRRQMKPANGEMHLSELRSRPVQTGSWKVLVSLGILYVSLFIATDWAFGAVPSPLPVDAPAGLFAEGRARATTYYLANTIGHRQVSTLGEEAAAVYLRREAGSIASFAAAHRPDLDVVVVREQVTGSIGKQKAFRFEIANVYNNLTNIILRVAPKGNCSDVRSLLVNAHYDSTLGSPGASDCASCVGVALEMARVLVTNASLQLHSPVIFLFNGGEETLMQASHGFMATSPYAKQLGAFINLESTGPWGPDVLFQHTGDWTLRAYARAAPHPRGNTVAQDFFELGLIPADTDFRMFSYRHYGDVPGIDVAFLFDGTAYHTCQDQSARIREGTLQAMGDNMLASALEFSRLLGLHHENGEPVHDFDRDSSRGHAYFDVLASWMIVYGHRTAIMVHNIPLLAIVVLSSASSMRRDLFIGVDKKIPGLIALLWYAERALMSIVTAVLLPALLGAALVLFTGNPITWYGRAVAPYALYVPTGLAGLLLPTTLSSEAGQSGAAPARGRHASMGVALVFAASSLGLTIVGMHSAYMMAAWSLGAVLSALASPADLKTFSFRLVLPLCASFAVPLLICLPTASSVTNHIAEKIGLAGSAPGLLGAAVPDIVIGAISGIAVVLESGTVWPYIAAAIGSRRTLRRLVVALLATSFAVAALDATIRQRGSGVLARALGHTPESLRSGGVHPYSTTHPKRVLVQHVHRHDSRGRVYESAWTFASLDAIPVEVALPPALAKAPEVPHSNADWVGLYPLNYLVTGTARQGPAPPPEARAPSLRRVSRMDAFGLNKGLEMISSLWNLFLYGTETQSPKVVDGESERQPLDKKGVESPVLREKIIEPSIRLHLELDTVQPAWALLNVTGEVRAWSLGSEVATTEVSGSRQCHMVRYASGPTTSKWRFWMDVPRNQTTRIDLYVKHLEATPEISTVLMALPEWVSAGAVTTWQSVWEFRS